MEQALKKLPRPPTDAVLNALGQFDLASVSPGDLRQALAQVTRDADSAFAAYAELVNKGVDDLCRLLAGGGATDVERLVGSLLKEERAMVASKAVSERQASSDLKRLAAVAPENLAVVNEILKEVLVRADRLATLFS